MTCIIKKPNTRQQHQKHNIHTESSSIWINKDGSLLIQMEEDSVYVHFLFMLILTTSLFLKSQKYYNIIEGRLKVLYYKCHVIIIQLVFN